MEPPEKLAGSELTFPEWLTTNQRGALTQEQRDALEKYLYGMRNLPLLQYVTLVGCVFLGIFFAWLIHKFPDSIFVASFLILMGVLGFVGVMSERRRCEHIQKSLQRGKVICHKTQVSLFQSRYFCRSVDRETGKTLIRLGKTLQIAGNYRLYFLADTDEIVAILKID